MQEASQKYRRSVAVPVFVVLFIFSLGLSMYLFVRYAENSKMVQNQQEELIELYLGLQLNKDSIQDRLIEVERLLQERIDKNLAQLYLNNELRKELVAKKSELKLAYGRISKILNKKDEFTSPTVGYKNLLRAQDEISKLQKINSIYLSQIEELQKINSNTKQDAQLAFDRAASFGAQNDSLLLASTIVNQKLRAANILRVVNFRISPIRMYRGRHETINKARKVERLKCEFMVSASNFIPCGDKEVSIRVKSPNGSVIVKETQELTDISEPVTLRQTMTYDGTEKLVTYYYQQLEAYAKGEYSAELLEDGAVLARCTFLLL